MAQGDERREGGVCLGVPDQITDLRRDLVGFAFSLTRDEEAARDLAQEAIARALARTRQFNPGTNLKAWLYRIAFTVHVQLQRQRRRTATLSLEAVGEAGLGLQHPRDTVERAVLARAELDAVAAVLRSLPSRLSEPLLLSAVEELSYAEIARRLEIPIGTVMSRIHRARRLLMSRLVETTR